MAVSAETKTIQVCLLILTTIAVAFALTYTKFMLVPFVFSIFTFATFAPIVYWIQVHLKLPRLIAISIALLGVALISALIIILMLPTLKQIIYGVNNYESYMANAIQAIEQKLPGVQIDQSAVLNQIAAINPATHIRNLTGQTLMLVGNISLVVIYTAFMLVGESKPEDQSPLLKTIFMKIFEYTIKKTFLALGAGVVFFIILAAFQLELVFIFVIAAVVLNFIPTVGPIVAVLLPLPVVFYSYGLEWQFFMIFSLLGTMQFIIGNIIEPYVLGEIMDLHPITVLICLVFWGLIWGLAGMFLAVPITAVLKIVFDRIEATHIFAEILAGRISTARQFYEQK